MLALMSGKTPVISNAVILQGPKTLGLGQLDLTDPGPDDLVVDVRHSGISTGTEKLFWSGEMPPFPGMGYPLVPGYEAAGEVVVGIRDVVNDDNGESPLEAGGEEVVCGADV